MKSSRAASLSLISNFSLDFSDEAETLSWELRVSPRAKYARLQIKPFGGLEVVIPTRFPRREIPALVAKHATWIHRQLARQKSLNDSIQLPDQLCLAFDQSRTNVVYANNPQEGAIDTLCIRASDYPTRVKELRSWLRKRARRLFPPMLDNIAQQTGLDYAKVSIRSQRTRWGSCSIRGNINLNDQLLFLPQATVAYLMIHELCHTKQLNHSPAFWRLVQQHCVEFREHELALNQARAVIPEWFLKDLYS